MTRLENLSFPIEYFQDEVRDGFYVPEMMKRFWAAQLVVMSEIAKICDRHQIKWYADMGTLIGAVRHNGYIPWDDDFDISMLRDDWEKFFEYARKELPEEYMVLTVHDNEEYDLALGRITNGKNIDCSKSHMERFYGCPYSVGVDIFAMDKIYSNREKDDERKERGKAVAEASKLIGQKGMDDPYVRKLLADIERDNHITLHRKGKISRELILLFDKIMRECRDEDAREVASMYVWIVADWANVPIEVYQESMEAPFENTYLRIPTRYDQLLKIYYGDYMTVKRGSGAHGYPCFANQIEMLTNKLGHHPYRFTFDRSTFSTSRKKPRYIDNFLRPVEVLKRVHRQIDASLNKGKNQEGLELLQSCQDMAVSLGNLIEKRFGDDTDAVRALESYCEVVFEQAGSWTVDSVSVLDLCIDEAASEIRRLFENRKRILFLPCRAKWWNTMKPLYERTLHNDHTDISVIPIPYYDCDYMGNIGEIHDERDLFPKDGHFTDFDKYDLVGTRPDVIVIQVPYDGSSCSLTVPERLYSNELLGYTDELVYMPCFDVTDPVDDSDPVITTLKYLIEQPAVVNADKVILKTEAIRSLYISVLAELAGEETRNYWEKKICLINDYKI